MTEVGGRAPRADSVRNRGRILAAARDEISTSGPGVGMAEIARSAGVAVGTLYRHFPTKADLIAAILAEYVEHVAARATALGAEVADGAKPAGEAVVEFLRFVLEASAVNHAVKAVARAMGAEEVVDPRELRAAEALAAMLLAAQQQGTVRAGVSVQDVYLLVSSAPMDQPKPARDRWLQLVCRGIETA